MTIRGITILALLGALLACRDTNDCARFCPPGTTPRGGYYRGDCVCLETCRGCADACARQQRAVSRCGPSGCLCDYTRPPPEPEAGR